MASLIKVVLDYGGIVYVNPKKIVTVGVAGGVVSMELDGGSKLDFAPRPTYGDKDTDYETLDDVLVRVLTQLGINAEEA